MTRRLRAFIFWTMVLIFLIITPIVLSYALGYSYDWQQKKIVQTGGLYIKSTPKNLDIFIDGKKKKKTPCLIKRLIPRDYEIRLEKKDFHSWQKKLTIKPGLVTEAKNILLIPSKIRLELIAEEIPTLENYFLTTEEKNKIKLAEKTVEPNAGYKIFKDNIFYIKKPNYILYKTDLSGSFKEQLSLMPLPYDSGKISYQIIVSPAQQIAVLSNQKHLYFFDRNKKIFEPLSEGVINAQFSQDNKKLLWQTDNEIWVYWLEDFYGQPNKKAGEKEFITRFSQKIDQAIWYLDSQHIVFSVNDKIKITELDSRDQRNTVDFLTIKEPQILFKDKYLYILSKGKLYKTRVTE